MRRRDFVALANAAICVLWIVGVPSALCQDSGKPPKPNSELEHCRGAKDERGRAQCYQNGNSGAAGSPSQQEPAESGTWQLARTPNPAGGPDSISITKIDAAQSDQDIAGLTLRCGEGATTEVLVVLANPLPLRTHPRVTVVAGSTSADLTASVAMQGALVLLPEKASALLETTWQSVPELTVTIVEGQRSLHGVIPLGDISSAMRTLQANCPKALHGR
jgi:hypothetical protein